MKEDVSPMTNDDKAVKRVSWSCRFHPTDWFHEVGCPHCDWTKEELRSALETAKYSNQVVLKEFMENMSANPPRYAAESKEQPNDNGEQTPPIKG